MTADIAGIGFLSPGRLWLLAGVAALGIAYLVTQSRRSSYAVRFTNLELLDSVAPKRPGWRRHLPAVFMLAALALSVGAFAQPTRDERVPREKATIVVAIDTSLSMMAEDVEPSRLEAAKVAAKEFVEMLPPRLNVGLVTFNGIAQVAVAPTQNRDELLTAIDQLRLGERTAIGEAIYASLEAIRSTNELNDVPADVEDPSGEANPDGDSDGADSDEEVPARIVLMSDGSTTVGRPDAQASAAAKRAGVPVSTIAFGTPHGTIQIEGQPGLVPVAVEPEALAEIANDTDGTAFSAASADELGAVYDDIGSAIGYETEEREITETFVAASLVALFAAAVMSQLWFSRLP